MDTRPIAREPGHFISTSRADGRAVDLLNRIFIDAANIGASDVHIEDQDGGTCRIRFRTGGDLQEIDVIDKATAREVDAKIRSKCRMSLSEHMNSLDGRLFLEIEDSVVDIRVSIVPTRTGQSIACRLLDQRNAARSINDITMTADVRASILQILGEPDGLILMTGPTGSGKTSTLYAMLNRLNGIESKIVTIEDPVEYRLQGAQQININDHLTFARALRSVLRQDPDVILVGEIRDAETAAIAVQSSLTGHLVLSTLHANDCATTITRLIDLGVDPFTLGSTLRCVISQRLLRRLCPVCRIEYRPADSDLAWLEEVAPDLRDETFWHTNHDGCDQCTRGYQGRVPVLEMMTGDAAVKTATLTNNREKITAAATRQPQYQTLLRAGIEAARNGETTLTEVRRIAK